MINLKSEKEQLKANYRAFVNAYNSALDQSYKKQLAAMLPGQTAPQKMFTNEDAEEFRNVAAKYEEKANSIIEAAKKKVSEAVAAAPGTEAASYISILATREDVAEYEIEAALSKYGENYNTYRAIQDIAARHKIHVADHPAARLLEDISAFEKNNVVYSLEHVESVTGNMETDIEFYSGAIDGTFFGLAI